MRKIRAAVVALLALTGLALPPAAPASAAATIDRAFTVATPAGTNETVSARNTYSWEQFDAVEVTARLNAGAKTITFGDPAYYAPNIDKITVAPAVLSVRERSR